MPLRKRFYRTFTAPESLSTSIGEPAVRCPNPHDPNAEVVAACLTALDALPVRFIALVLVAVGMVRHNIQPRHRGEFIDQMAHFKHEIIHNFDRIEAGEAAGQPSTRGASPWSA